MRYGTTAKAPEDAALDKTARGEEASLLEASDWQPGLIELLAVEAGLAVTPERLETVRYVRAHFEQHHSVPEARTVLKHMRALWGEERATGRHLYHLFPHGYGQRDSKIAANAQAA